MQPVVKSLAKFLFRFIAIARGRGTHFIQHLVGPPSAASIASLRAWLGGPLLARQPGVSSKPGSSRTEIFSFSMLVRRRPQVLMAQTLIWIGAHDKRRPLPPPSPRLRAITVSSVRVSLARPYRKAPIRRWLVFLPFIRLFWNHIFTWRSLKFKRRAKSKRFCLFT
jgi:hypothetical protein